jgi:hypothetical protein
LVSNLHNQITLLQEENRILGVKLAGAENDVDQQLEWSHIRAERRRIASTKRTRPSGEEDIASLEELSAKRPRKTVSMIGEGIAEDTTNGRLPSAHDA